MNKVSIHTCPVCDGTRLQRALTCVDHCASGEMFHLCRCADCGFLFTQDFPDEQEIGRYYDFPQYISLTDDRRGLVNRMYHRVRTHMLNRKAKLVIREAHRPTGSLLDVGTGTAYFADRMARAGWQVEAVEKSPEARQFALDKFGLKVKSPDEMGDFGVGQFHVITLWHVLEHIQDVGGALDAYHRLLADDGILLLALPNCSSFDARKYGAYWAAYDVPRHLWHFTPDSIQRFALRHGFVMTERRPMPFDAFYISILTEHHMRHTLPVARGMLTGCAAYFSSLVHKERSSSMTYVFRKKSA